MNFEKELIEFKSFDNIGITGLTNQLISFSVENLYKQSNRDILLITNSLFEANIIYSSLSKINENALLFPMDDFLTSEAIAISPELESIRISTLNKLSTAKQKNIVVTNLMGILRYLPTLKTWKNSNVVIKNNMSISKDELLNKLLSLGYDKNYMVTKTGDLSSRGFILDVFPINSDYPIRIEFWGDEIDSIRYFDVDSQRSLDKIDEFKITPFTEFINEKGIEIEKKQKYLPFVLNSISSLYDYLENPITVFKDYNQIKSSYVNLRNEIFEYSKNDKTDYKTNYMFDLDEIKFGNKIYLLTVDNLLSGIKLDKLIDLKSRSITSFKSNTSLINEYIDNSIKNGKTIIIVLSNINNLKNLKRFIDFDIYETTIDKIYDNSVNVILKEYNEGFEINNTVVLTEKELFDKKNNNSKVRSKFKIGTKINSINNLEKGDYVVHMSNGIGIYEGIKKILKNGNEKDYIEISYLDKDKLYIPVEKIDLISKYSSKEGATPRLNKLGGIEWQKTKLRIKNKIKDIAGRLIKVQAERKLKRGYAFNEDDSLQLEFEKEFEYELTKDQLISINRIKKEMEMDSPMDMLLCGDVGYGKTEVAFRAIFKAINSKKQVAYLCPTTILSNQQYNNSLKRFSNFGVNIALVNRFTTTKEYNNIVEKLKEGKIDLVFGTHRLLSDDIKYKDLGLLVIDEEQRFGVTHKEKIKEYKASVDVLTLSATPIPRTLQMSLTGIRSLSLIETPPESRYPVQTYVVEESKQLIKDAIYKEISRDGQVFILFNRVDGLEEKLFELKSLVPEATYQIAHGQMSKEKIEDTMTAFINNEFNVLLCTTIIETGIDIPNVNTLIIYDADNFGLSQLYQIRGRVGRSNKIAYAYLMYKKNKVLNETAIKRLNAIKEFTELGSGFSIAMRDLSIRGAGDILGSEQAGFIESVGYDLYLKLLNEQVDVLKGNKVKKEETEDDKPLLDVKTHIDDNYVKEDAIKIEIHKLINEIDSYDKLVQVKEELIDRFGKISEDLEIYMYSEWFEKMAKKLEIVVVNQTRTYIEFALEKNVFEKLDVSDLFYEASKINMSFKFQYKFSRLYIKLTFASLTNHFIYDLTKLLCKIDDMLV